MGRFYLGKFLLKIRVVTFLNCWGKMIIAGVKIYPMWYKERVFDVDYTLTGIRLIKLDY